MSRAPFPQEVKKKMSYISFNSILPTPFSVGLPGLSQQPLWYLLTASGRLHWRCLESVERMMGESESKNVDEGSRASHGRWSSHFAKHSMSWTTWTKKEAWSRDTTKEEVRKIQLETGHAVPGGWVIVESCSHFSFLLIIPPVLRFPLLVTDSLLPRGWRGEEVHWSLFLLLSNLRIVWPFL